MELSERALLAALVSLAHGPCDHLRTMRVREVHRGILLWSGEVAVFRLDNAPGAQCFAWMDPDHPVCPVVMLRSTTITSAATAVRAYQRQGQRAEALA